MPAVVEILCAAIVLSYVVTRAHFGGDRRGFLAAYAWLAVAAAIGEASCIRLYDFYAYGEGWTVFVGPVPLLVVLIWPCVVISAWDISRHLVTGDHVWMLAGAIVLADASLIEPIAVQAKLWQWHEPGLFAVPPVGVLGWALFGASAVLFLERVRDWRLRSLVVLVTLVAVHAGLLALWWGGLRWINVTWPELPAVGLVWVISLAVALRSVIQRAGCVPRWVMWVRVAPAIFFFGLLVLHVRELPLWLWALAFAPPYLSLTRLSDR